jgi:hypothetical protein
MAGRFNLDDYVDVAERIDQFYAKYPEGRLLTELVNVANWQGKQSQFIVKSYAFDGQNLLSTGLAEESFGNSGPNQTSALENAETSSLGRCLANLNFSTTRSGNRQRASKQEMQKVERGTAPEMTQDQIVLKGLLGQKFKVAKERKTYIESVLFHDVEGVSSLTPEEVKLCIDTLTSEKGKNE